MTRVIATAVLLGGLATSLAGQAPPSTNNRLRLQPGSTIDRYIVVLKRDAAGPVGKLSHANEVAQAIAASHGVQPRAVFSHVLNGFSVTAPAAMARVLS